MFNHFLFLILISFLSFNAWAAPTTLNFQARIKKPDGTNLESSDVSFRFKYLNSAGTCTVYIEDFNNQSMTGSAGNVNLALGAGAKVFPPTSTILNQTFNNAISNMMACSEGGTYAPTLSTERRILKVEFVYPGSGGLQVLNGVEINSVPYAWFASDTSMLGGTMAAMYTKFSDFTTCTGGDVLTFNGTAFSCITPGAATFTGSLAGDVSGTQSTTVVDTVGGKTAAQISTSVNDTLNATSGSTASRIVKRDASGNASFSTLQANDYYGHNLVLFEPTDTNYVTVKVPTTFAAGNYVLTLPDSKGLAGQVLSTDGNGVTSWIAPAAGGGVTSVTASLPLSATAGATPNISMPAATTGVDGYLSAADFTIFNDKVSTASGTVNRITKYISGGSIGDSNISDNGTLVSISTNAAVNGIHIGRGTGNNSWSTVVGTNALSVNSTGERNTAQGHGTLASNTTGNWNSAFGTESQRLTTTGSANSSVGDGSLYNNTTGNENTAMGDDSLQFNISGNNNSAVGQGALHNNTTGSNNSGFGYHAGNLITTGSNNVVLGSNDAASIATSSNNIIISDGSGNIRQQINSSGLVGIGMAPSTYMLSVNGDINIPAGSNFKINGVNLSAGGGTVTGTGTTNKISKFTAAGAIGDSNISDNGTLVSISTDALINGLRFGRGTGSNTENTASGSSVLLLNTSGIGNTGNGYEALASNTTGNYNAAVGYHALNANTTGSANAALGDSALESSTGGSENAAVGDDSLQQNTTGNSNTAMGQGALSSNTTGSNNSALGHHAGDAITTGSNNVVIGTNSGSSIATSSNNIILSDGSGNIRQQINSSGLVGIGMTPATYMLSVNGDVNIPAGSNFKINGVNISSGGVTGSGTTNKVAKFTAAGAVGNSNITDNGTVVALSTDATVNGILVGRGAGNFNTNTVVGLDALGMNSVGENNIAIGDSALFFNSSGTFNVAIGSDSLFSNGTGGSNVAIGNNTLFQNTSGSGNLALGNGTLFQNTTGVNNVGIGGGALSQNTTGNNSLAIGVDALSQSTTGSFNTAVGLQALYNNTTGYSNVSMGPFSMRNNTSGSDNVAYGSGSLYANTIGAFNVATGNGSLGQNQSGDRNVANGYDALGFSVTGYSNTAVGFSALKSIEGYKNTAIGFEAGRAMNSGSKNVIIGSNDGTSIDGTNNNILISDGDGIIRLKVDSAGLVSTPGDLQTAGCIYYSSGSWGTCVSDERLKEDVHAFDLGLDTLLGINPVNFKYNGKAGRPNDGHEQLGVIAQDLEKAAPSLVKRQMVEMHPGDKVKTEIKVVDYGAFTYVIINSVKDLYNKWFSDSIVIHREIASVKAENVELKQANETMQKENEKIKQENDQIRQRLDQIEQMLKTKQ